MSITFTKDPNALLDYTVDWTDWLDTDTIATSSFVATAGLTISSSSNTTKKAVVWLSGGQAGTVYTVTNHITTAGGRQDDRSFTVRVKEK
jgi:hypothetical protein